MQSLPQYWTHDDGLAMPLTDDEVHFSNPAPTFSILFLVLVWLVQLKVCHSAFFSPLLLWTPVFVA